MFTTRAKYEMDTRVNFKRMESKTFTKRPSGDDNKSQGKLIVCDLVRTFVLNKSKNGPYHTTTRNRNNQDSFGFSWFNVALTQKILL